MDSPDLTISIVPYNTPRQKLLNCLESVCRTTLPFKCFVIDNARSESVERLVEEAQEHFHAWTSLEYVPNDNTGYGRAHNIAIRKVLDTGLGRYHLVVNPDIDFGTETLEKLTAFMDQNQDVGLVMPTVLCSDGTPQNLCKLLPTPGHLLARRFFSWLVKKQDAVYQLEFADFNTSFECPSLSGCFMFFRTQTLKEAGLFDEQFFMYFEDVDMVRRVGQHSKTLYCPLATVTHHYEKGSYSSPKLLLNHIISGVKYFNKWGWLFDPQRRVVNQKTLKRLKGSD